MMGGYGICWNSWLEDERIKNELRLLIKISSLTAKNGYCTASNDYLAKYFNTTVVTISRQIKKLETLGYIEIEYKKRGAEVLSRKITIHDYQKHQSSINKNDNRTINKNVKENNISINITSKKNVSKDTSKKEYEDELKELQIDPDLFEDFLEHRKKLKAPNTPRAINTLLKKLRQLAKEGNCPNELIETAYLNGWRTVFPPKKKFQKKQPQEGSIGYYLQQQEGVIDAKII